MSTPHGETPPPPTDAPNPDDKTATSPQPDTSDRASGGEPPKTFTQADLDAAEARGRKTAQVAATKKQQDAQLTDADRYRQRAEAAETALRAHDARASLERAALDAAAANPSKVYRLLKDEIEFDDEGQPTNVKDLVTRAKRDFPEEFGGPSKSPGSADGGAGKAAGAQTKSSMNDFIRHSTGRS